MAKFYARSQDHLLLKDTYVEEELKPTPKWERDIMT